MGFKAKYHAAGIRKNKGHVCPIAPSIIHTKIVAITNPKFLYPSSCALVINETGNTPNKIIKKMISSITESVKFIYILLIYNEIYKKIITHLKHKIKEGVAR